MLFLYPRESVLFLFRLSSINRVHAVFFIPVLTHSGMLSAWDFYTLHCRYHYDCEAKTALSFRLDAHVKTCIFNIHCYSFAMLVHFSIIWMTHQNSSSRVCIHKRVAALAIISASVVSSIYSFQLTWVSYFHYFI